jgi:hypothetical protein
MPNEGKFLYYVGEHRQINFKAQALGRRRSCGDLMKDMTAPKVERFTQTKALAPVVPPDKSYSLLRSSGFRKKVLPVDVNVQWHSARFTAPDKSGQGHVFHVRKPSRRFSWCGAAKTAERYGGTRPHLQREALETALKDKAKIEREEQERTLWWDRKHEDLEKLRTNKRHDEIPDLSDENWQHFAQSVYSFGSDSSWSGVSGPPWLPRDLEADTTFFFKTYSHAFPPDRPTKSQRRYSADDLDSDQWTLTGANRGRPRRRSIDRDKRDVYTRRNIHERSPSVITWSDRGSVRSRSDSTSSKSSNPISDQLALRIGVSVLTASFILSPILALKWLFERIRDGFKYRRYDRKVSKTTKTVPTGGKSALYYCPECDDLYEKQKYTREWTKPHPKRKPKSKAELDAEARRKRSFNWGYEFGKKMLRGLFSILTAVGDACTYVLGRSERGRELVTLVKWRAATSALDYLSVRRNKSEDMV